MYLDCVPEQNLHRCRETNPTQKGSSQCLKKELACCQLTVLTTASLCCPGTYQHQFLRSSCVALVNQKGWIGQTGHKAMMGTWWKTSVTLSGNVVWLMPFKGRKHRKKFNKWKRKITVDDIEWTAPMAVINTLQNYLYNKTPTSEYVQSNQRGLGLCRCAGTV